VKIGNYIHQLLLENDTVIIPGFGAFISTYKPPEIDEETEKISPPSKQISFNAAIRNNDGLLVGFIAENEEISHFDALRKIEKDREKILYRLDKGEEIALKKIGILWLNENNEIEFKPTIEENLLIDSYGLDSTPVVEKAPETEPVKNKITTDSPISTEDQNKRKKKKTGWLWLLLIFIPLVVAGYFILNKKQPVTPITNEGTTDTVKTINEKPETPVETTKTDSIQPHEIDSLKTTESETDTNTVDTVISARYILVGGSFKEESNAEKYLMGLKEKGFEPFHLGKRGNFFIIGIGRYNSMAEANNARREFLRQNPGSGVWIKEEE